jgi:hypothetical protein
VGGMTDEKISGRPFQVGAGEMEAYLDVVAGVLVVLSALVIREANSKINFLNLLFEQISLIQEKDHRCFDKPFGIANFLEEFERFVHTVGRVILL